jgi:hypothetical protein
MEVNNDVHLLALEQLERQIAQLPPQEQLKLVAHISQRLSTMLPSMLMVISEAPFLKNEARGFRLSALSLLLPF